MNPIILIVDIWPEVLKCTILVKAKELCLFLNNADEKGKNPCHV